MVEKRRGPPSLPPSRLWKRWGPGETGRAASEDTFLAEKSHGSLNLDGNCPSLSCVSAGTHQGQGKQWQKKPHTCQRCHCYSATDNRKTDKGASTLLLFNPDPYFLFPNLALLAAKHVQSSSTRVAFLLVCLVIFITAMVSTGLKQTIHRSVSVVCLFPLSCLICQP